MKVYYDNGSGIITYSNRDKFGGEFIVVRKDVESKHSEHSDRLFQFNPEKFNKCRMNVFGNTSQYFDFVPSEKIEQFLCEYLEQKIALVRITKYMNVSSGFPYWRFDYTKEQKMPTNDSSQPIQFVMFGNVYTYIVKYPKSHYGSFINDLIRFGTFIQLEQDEVIKNVNHFVLNWWEDYGYEIEIP